MACENWYYTCIIDDITTNAYSCKPATSGKKHSRSTLKKQARSINSSTFEKEYKKLIPNEFKIIDDRSRGNRTLI